VAGALVAASQLAALERPAPVHFPEAERTGSASFAHPLSVRKGSRDKAGLRKSRMGSNWIFELE